MRFLRLLADGQTIDKDSFDAYFIHLDAIRDCLPIPLYLMLRYPERAYRTGKTFFDGALLEWRDVMDPATWKTRTEVRILGPNHEREFRFTFYDPEIFRSEQSSTSPLGDLYCVEVSRSVEGVYSFYFMGFNRLEHRVDCLKFEYSETC
jgi:hypothetical protein